MGWISFYVVNVVLNVIKRNVGCCARVEVWNKKCSTIRYQRVGSVLPFSFRATGELVQNRAYFNLFRVHYKSYLILIYVRVSKQ